MANQATSKSLMKTMRALLRRRPFDTIKVEDICAVAGVSRRTFYRYYPDKYALLNDLYRIQFFEKLPRNERWNTWDYHDLICEQIYKDVRFFRHAFDVTGQNGFWEGCRNLLAPLIKKDYDGSGLEESTLDDFIERDTNWLFHAMSKWLSSDPIEEPKAFSERCRRQYAEYARIAWLSASTVKEASD